MLLLPANVTAVEANDTRRLLLQALKGEDRAGVVVVDASNLQRFDSSALAVLLECERAAQAWGGYWSWDPKETWALIVWLNYAAWLHMRLMKGLRGTVSAWWALAGLAVTSFAFLGVNMFLSGLHSYGEL